MIFVVVDVAGENCERGGVGGTKKIWDIFWYISARFFG